ncbi:MAG: hypothetical protein FJ267_17500 [Planctomycetes bacterium]|nr:hypothetical protein [Planctomycetota bacterium]
MKGRKLEEPQVFEVLRLLRGMMGHIGWILDVNPNMERWSTLVDSYDIRSLSENLKKIAQLTGLEEDLNSDLLESRTRSELLAKVRRL